MFDVETFNDAVCWSLARYTDEKSAQPGQLHEGDVWVTFSASKTVFQTLYMKGGGRKKT